jgi:hypothetical protein
MATGPEPRRVLQSVAGFPLGGPRGSRNLSPLPILFYRAEQLRRPTKGWPRKSVVGGPVPARPPTHNTGRYHVRPRPACLSPSCVRSAPNRHNRRGSCVVASVDLANMTHVRHGKRRHATSVRHPRPRGRDQRRRDRWSTAASVAGGLVLAPCPAMKWASHPNLPPPSVLRAAIPANAARST